MKIQTKYNMWDVVKYTKHSGCAEYFSSIVGIYAGPTGAIEYQMSDEDIRIPEKNVKTLMAEVKEVEVKE